MADRRRRRLASVSIAVALIALPLGAGLLWFAGWREPMARADAAAAAGQWKDALASYAEAEARFTAWPAAQQIFPAQYRAAAANQLMARYRLGAIDEVIETAESAPDSAARRFWTGAALFAKSAQEEKAEARIGLLGRATDEFKAALELEPGNWDVIYNYELSRRLFDELRKKPETPPKQMLQLLRPQPREGNKPTRRIG